MMFILLPILLVWGIARMEYQEKTKDVTFHGTIWGYREVERNKFTPIILNPADLNDYVEISFVKVKKTI